MSRLSFVGMVSLLLTLIAPGAAQEADPFRAHVRPTDPLSPADAQKTFELPPGFEIQLFAAEPEIAKPLNMAFDARGRLWVTNTVEYPHPAPPDRKGRDSIKVLEDTNGDGRADKITTFADGLNIPMGLYPYKNGVIAFSIPNIWFLEDTDGDDKADRRTKLYGPFGFERDTHGLNNSFRRGFDGWIYANHGFNNETIVTGEDGHTVEMQSGNTYRFRPDGSRIEQFTWGQVNPFGSAFDTLGNLFTADCHSKPVYQLLRGGYYPSFGKPHDGLGFVPPMMDHLHGSTAIAGVALYNDEKFPPEFRGNMFSGNVMTSRVNRNSLVYHGSTIIAKEEPDLIVTGDPWFRPVDLRVGPDGALYVADFYNRIIGHYEVPLDHPGRDRTSGRIWRVVYTGQNTQARPPQKPQDLTQLSIDELIGVLGEENLTKRMLATDRIVDHFGQAAVESVWRAFFESKNHYVRAHTLWILFRIKAIDAEVIESAAGDPHRLPRLHAMKLLSETPEWSESTAALVAAKLPDEDAFVRRAAADALGQHPEHNSVAPLLEALATVSEGDKDNHLRHTIRMAIRNQLRSAEYFRQVRQPELSKESEREIASICLGLKTEQAGEFLLESIQKQTPPRGELVEILRHAARYAPPERSETVAAFARQRFAGDPELQLSLLTAVHAGLVQRGESPGETLLAWGEELAGRLLNSLDDASLAWGNRPIDGMRFAENPWGLQSRPAADGKRSRLLSSHPHGEHLTGVLRSKPFTIPAKFNFYLAGHDGLPGKPKASRNFVRLRDAETNALLAEASPPRSDTAQKIGWDLSEHAGKQGYLELVDGFQGRAYAWLAAGGFDPAVVAIPEGLSPRAAAERQKAVATLAATLKLKHLEEHLAGFLSSAQTEPSVAEACAWGLLAIDPEGRPAALLPLLNDASVAETLRLRAARAIAAQQAGSVSALLAEALRTSPQRLQVTLAEALAADPSGAEMLLKLTEEGHASPRLLLNANVRARLDASAPGGDIEKRIQQLTAGLPSADEEIARLIATRLREFSNTATSREVGFKVFEKNCAACHQLDGKGPLIGPQLDGIGNRGLERLVEDLLDPNRNVDVAFRAETIVTTEGKVYTGLFRREEGASLVYADNKGKEFTIPTDEIEERRKSNLSLMPANVAEVITREDFHHLLAFLLSKTARKEEPARRSAGGD